MAASREDAGDEGYSEEQASESSCAKAFARKLQRFCKRHFGQKRQRLAHVGNCIECKCCLSASTATQQTPLSKDCNTKADMQECGPCQRNSLPVSLVGGTSRESLSESVDERKDSLNSQQPLKVKRKPLQNKNTRKITAQSKPCDNPSLRSVLLQPAKGETRDNKLTGTQNRQLLEEGGVKNSLIADIEIHQLDQQDLSPAKDRKQNELSKEVVPTPPLSELESSNLELVSEIQVSDSCFSVSSHENVVYVGLSNGKGIDRIENQSVLHPSFIPFKEPVWSLATDKDGAINTLVSNGACWQVQKSDTANKKSTCWQVSKPWQFAPNIEDCEYGMPALACVGDKIVTANVLPQHFTIYSKHGEQCHTTWFEPLETTDVDICEADDTSVIMSSRVALTISRVDVYSGAVKWCRILKHAPGGVTCYANKYVLFSTACSSLTTITILDAQTGKCLKILTDLNKRKRSWIYRMCMIDDLLVIPRCNERKVLFYRIDWPPLPSDDLSVLCT